ncbi:hypothetical protein [Arcobacter sp.]|uniref:hypothetical protein n=1 Tax=unclassified Arcobacter TaxID=2593671 RepID=UPI003AFF8222
MEKFFKVDKNNIVIQVQPNAENGFKKTVENVVCGMKYENEKFVLVENVGAKREREESQAKIQKTKELNELVIDINTVLYDANQEAIGNMAAVVAIATATFQRAISVGIVKAGETVPTIMTPAEAYKYVYKDQTVTWKGADNKPHTVQLESLVEASEKAMTAKAAILFKY